MAIARTADVPAIPEIFRIRPLAIWAFLRAQPISFWLVNFYVFLEYVRPQTVWPSLAFLPWAQLALLGSTAALLIEGGRLRLHPPIGALILVFATIVVVSSVFAYRPAVAYDKWILFFSWVLVYLLITNTMTTERRFFIFTLAFLLYSFKMSQHGFRTWISHGFGFSSWGVTGAPGWFHNSGEFGIQMCVFLPLSIEFILAMRSHWGKWMRWFFYLFPITAVGSIVASSSRGAMVGAGAVAIWWVARSKHRVRALTAMALLAAATWFVVPPEQKARFSTMGDDDTSVSRIDRWEAGIEMANEHPLFGIGYNNWIVYYGPLSHNVFIEAWSELGYTGLLAFLALIAATFAVNARTRRLLRSTPTSTSFMKHMAYGLDGALIGFMASGFFVTVLYYPYFWFNLAMTAALHGAARHARQRARTRPLQQRLRAQSGIHLRAGNVVADLP